MKGVQHVYSYVPKQSLDSVMEHGLHGNKSLVKRKDLLRAVAKAKGVSPRKLRANIDKTRASYRKNVFEGPNVVFSMIPKGKKLSKNHPLNQGDYVPIKIDLSKIPKAKVFGIELKPYDGVSKGRERRRFLTKREVRKFQRDPNLWDRYSDPDDVGYYAPDVPHASIHTPSGHIDPKYLTVVPR